MDRFVGPAARSRTVELVAQESRLSSRQVIVRRASVAQQERTMQVSVLVALSQTS